MPTAKDNAPTGALSRSDTINAFSMMAMGRPFTAPTLTALVAAFECWRDENGFGVSDIGARFRILVSMAAELLMSAAQREITTLDEKLYLQVYGKPETHTSRRAAAAR